MPSNAPKWVRWTSGANVLAGVWLVLAPFALGYSDVAEARWNDVIIGVAVAVIALVRVGAPVRYQEISWINFVLGIWLIAAPFVLGYDDVTAALTNDIVVGAIVLALAAASAVSSGAAPTRTDLQSDRPS